MELKLIMPKDIIWETPYWGVRNNGYVQLGHNSLNEHVYNLCSGICENGSKKYKKITQKINNLGNCQMKVTKIESEHSGSLFVHKTVEWLDKNRFYSVRRQISDKIVGGYAMNLEPVNRQFAKGFKGKLQKAALAIGTDANGCERPILNRFGAFMFDVAKKIR